MIEQNELDSLIPDEQIASKVLFIRGLKVMLDRDLAKLYDVETKVLNQAVSRKINRFPDDFMFRLSQDEFDNLKSQIVTSSWGGRRTLPYAFTEQGVAMLSSVLKSDRAVQVNIQIIKTFTRLRQILTHDGKSKRQIGFRVDTGKNKRKGRGKRKEIGSQNSAAVIVRGRNEVVIARHPMTRRRPPALQIAQWRGTERRSAHEGESK